MRLGSAGDPLRWYSSQPAKCGPLTSQFWRLPSDVKMKAPLRVPTRTRTLLTAFSFSLLCGFAAVNHPGYAELINQHTKSRGPKCFLQRHGRRTVFRQGAKYALGLRYVCESKHYGNALRLLVVLRRKVSALQYLVAQVQCGVENLIAPFPGYLTFDRHSGVGHHHHDFAAETLFVELKRSFALAVEVEIWIQSHSGLPGPKIIGTGFAGD